ncbi:MAG: inositol monophosphatase family protein [Rickettsia endosymbiont of Bryobia graminum]|nr:inositol monophosphatase family protein [Rickettsia endosymbiont of Bryobia graminum]
MENITNIIINASHKAVKFLRRDFLELSMLQRSSKGNYDFCNRSYAKAQEILRDELQKYSKNIFFPKDNFELDLDKISSEEFILIINPIDSIENLERSIPLFALSITCLKKIQGALTTICSVINFPALDRVYYAEKGQGVKSENDDSNLGRLRVSGRTSLNNSLIATDNITSNLPFLKNTRVFGSHCYGLLMLISGKVDAAYFSSLNYSLNAGFELIVKESGGVVTNNSKIFIATNPDLVEKLLS